MEQVKIIKQINQYFINLRQNIGSMISEQPLHKSIEEEDPQFQKISPQIKIYNRNFHLRRIIHEELQQQNRRQIHQLAEKPKLTHNSYIILVQKLEEELKTLISSYSDKNQEICFQHFQSIVSKLGKFQNPINEKEKIQLQIMFTQLWLLLIGYDIELQTISKIEVQRMLNLLFCPHPLRPQEIIELLNLAFPDLQKSRIRYLNEYPQTEDEILDMEGIVKLWIKLKNKKLSKNHRQKRLIPQQQKYSFKPQINPKSRQYAQKSIKKYLSINKLDNVKQSKLNELSGYISNGGQELSYHQLLYRRGLQKEQHLKTLRDKPPQVIKQKTLSQSEVKNIVQNLYVKRQRKQDVDHEKIKEDEQLKLCTFKPTLISNYEKRSTTPKIKNYNKEIQRLQKGRKEKERQQQLYNNLGQTKKTYHTKPPSFVQRDLPRLILEIKVGDSIQQLKLRGDEQPRLVAKKFIIRHGLQQSMQQTLQQVIEQQLAAL